MGQEKQRIPIAPKTKQLPHLILLFTFQMFKPIIAIKFAMKYRIKMENLILAHNAPLVSRLCGKRFHSSHQKENGEKRDKFLLA